MFLGLHGKECGAAFDLMNLYDAASNMDDMEYSEAWEKDIFFLLGVNDYSPWVLSSTLLYRTDPTPISSFRMLAKGNIWEETICAGTVRQNRVEKRTCVSQRPNGLSEMVWL